MPVGSLFDVGLEGEEGGAATRPFPAPPFGRRGRGRFGHPFPTALGDGGGDADRSASPS